MVEPNGRWGRRVQVVLECPRCAAETCHDIHYVAGLLHWERCVRCGMSWRASFRVLEQRYVCQLSERLTTKPARLLRELEIKPVAFTLSLPHLVASKPFRLAGELGVLIRLLDSPP